MRMRSNWHELNPSGKIAAGALALGMLSLSGGLALETTKDVQVNEQPLIEVDAALPIELAAGGLALVLAGQQLLIRSSRNRQ